LQFGDGRDNVNVAAPAGWSAVAIERVRVDAAVDALT
jgi:hypothetical protein